MNTSLIDQLKLAIQVESGEVPQSELQTRPIGGYDNSWVMCGTAYWNFQHYEYRRTPKPLECWVNVYDPSSIALPKYYPSKEAAERSANDHNAVCDEAGLGVKVVRIAVHMREVTND